jgi:hypothetical protein
MIFRTVFDAAHAGYPEWPFLLAFMIMAGVGALFVFRPDKIIYLTRAKLEAKDRIFFGSTVLIFGLFSTVVTATASSRDYRMVTSALESGRYDVVEGPVTDFVPVPPGRNSYESFVVRGQKFSYSDYNITSGFHNTALHGGPIHPGLYVRVSYIGNLIIRLEIAQ